MIWQSRYICKNICDSHFFKVGFAMYYLEILLILLHFSFPENFELYVATHTLYFPGWFWLYSLSPSPTSPAPTDWIFFWINQQNIPNYYCSAAAPAGKRHHPIYLSLSWTYQIWWFIPSKPHHNLAISDLQVRQTLGQGCLPSAR